MDDIDRAAEYQRRLTEAAVSQRKRESGLQATGHCHWCDEPVTGERRFCDSDCADDWERDRAKRRP